MNSPRAADQPVYVLYGALRSGSTLTRLILDAHPAIRCPDECDFMLDHLHPVDGGVRLDREALQVDRIFRGSGLRAPAGEDGRAAFFDLLGQQQDGETTLVLVLHRKLELLLDLVPDVRIIHLLRDPRDVARSSVGLGWAGNTWYGVNHWIRTETQWDRAASRLAAEQVLSVRYEDLLADPEPGLARICAFLGRPYDPAMLTFHETSTYAAIDPSLCYQWKRKQSAREIALVEHKVGPLLAARGYAPSGHAPHAPSGAERLKLWGANKVAVWRAIFRRYGFVDPILARLADKLGLRRLARGPKLRMHVKQNQMLK